MNRFFLNISIFIVSFTLVMTAFFSAKAFPKQKGEKTYINQTAATFNQKKVRVEIEIYDNTEKDYFDIVEVKLNGSKVPLLKANAAGKRARSYFKLKPGKYTLTWTIDIHEYNYPRTKTYIKHFEIKAVDKWLHISINGDKVEITT